MRFLVLILAWITPAVIAEALGWRGIWGSGSALGDFLVPIPVASGVLHVPSFAVAAGVIFSAHRLTPLAARWLPVLAFAVAVAALSLALDFDRLNSWLFMNYDPSGSPFRLDDNPLLLFIGTDVLWVGLYALMTEYSAPLRNWSLVPAVPALIVAINAIGYRTGGPVFDLGLAYPGDSRGAEGRMVYTSANYDDATFLARIGG